MLYPLKFRPRLVEKIWGGRRLETALGRPLPTGKLIGESWELYDFPPGTVDNSGQWISSEIANGPLAGRTLHSVIEEFGRALQGDVALLAGGQFPILIKYLDAKENSSVQVHPGTNLESKAWYVVENDPGARLYKGLRAGIRREQFRQAIADGTAESLMTAIPIKPGQCFCLPSGMIHALGAGTLVAEMQTPSDTTFRVFDFNRIDPATGKPRELQVDEALACIDFDNKEEPQPPRSHVAGVFTTVTRLVSCPAFKVEKVRFIEGIEEPVPYDEPVVWMMLQGQAEVKVDGMRQ
ncbi:MAG: type I phosphomannose isomerase catalytic subunit, partial [Bacillota bacterium]